MLPAEVVLEWSQRGVAGYRELLAMLEERPSYTDREIANAIYLLQTMQRFGERSDLLRKLMQLVDDDRSRVRSAAVHSIIVLLCASSQQGMASAHLPPQREIANAFSRALARGVDRGARASIKHHLPEFYTG